MDYKPNNALLPAGLSDLLPEEALKESQIKNILLDVFNSFGYLLVKPPLIEFEESMFSDSGKTLEHTMFRVIDPLSKYTLCIRSDITIQIARIASTRLSNAARPLRLSYAGDILRVEGNQLRPERQFSQVGYELIGSDNIYADVEVIILAVEALTKAGVGEISLDLTVPTLVSIICKELGLESSLIAEVRRCLDRKDLVSLRNIIPDSSQDTLTSFLKSVGPVDEALSALFSINLSSKSEEVLNGVSLIVSEVRKSLPNLSLTLDPSESRGFEYHTGLGFTIFGKNVRGELGRGGRYSIANGESATGFSVYLDSVIRAIENTKSPKKILVPIDTPIAVSSKLRQEGWVVVNSLSQEKYLSSDAKIQGFEYILLQNKPVKNK
tara:strand:+ start:1527 stop:2669 length:1143 start_codon:yes stop_codon:yes gene_type:complete